MEFLLPVRIPNSYAVCTSVIHPSESDQFPDYITVIFAKLNKWFQANNLLNIDKTNCMKFPNNKTSVN
jgi:hypothetical protein